MRHHNIDPLANIPQDSYHEYYGNPTASHPNVNPLHRSQFESDAALFVQLAHQPFIMKSDSEYSGSQDDPYSIAYTNLPFIRPEDLEQEILLYSPNTRDPRTIFEIRTPEDRINTDTSDITLRAWSTESSLQTTTPNNLPVSTTTKSKPITKIQEKLTYIQNHVTLIPPEFYD